MTTALSLTFSPAPWTPEGAGDFQQLQALFKAATEVRRVPGNLQTIGDPDAADEQGPLESEAAAVDATWDQNAADAREYQGEEP